MTKKTAAADAATKALAGVVIVCQVEPARTLALDERELVAQAAVERLARRTTHAWDELAWSPVLFDANNLQPSL